jgi:hypothetical protein
MSDQFDMLFIENKREYNKWELNKTGGKRNEFERHNKETITEGTKGRNKERDAGTKKRAKIIRPVSCSREDMKGICF